MILNPLTGTEVVKNDKDFLDRLRKVQLEENDILISSDIVSMFTNIDREQACKVIEQKLILDETFPNRTSLSPG